MPYEATPTMWADPADPAFEAYDPDDVEMAIINATWICWALSGRKLHSAGRRVELYRMPPGTNNLIRLMSPVDEFELAELLDTCDRETTSVIEGACCIGSKLRIGLPQGYHVYDRIPESDGCEKLVKTTYLVRSNLPPGSEQAVRYLALQYLLALEDSSKCKLPERVQSISRQGVSWTILDPQDFLDKGRTGLIRIDAWLLAVNPMGAKSKARVIHPAQGVLVDAWWSGYEPPGWSTSIDGGTP